MERAQSRFSEGGGEVKTHTSLDYFVAMLLVMTYYLNFFNHSIFKYLKIFLKNNCFLKNCYTFAVRIPLFNVNHHTLLNVKSLYLAISLFAFVFANATITDPQQGTVMVVHNANNFYAAEGSMAVKGLTIVASAGENASVLTVFNSTPPPNLLKNNALQAI